MAFRPTLLQRELRRRKLQQRRQLHRHPILQTVLFPRLLHRQTRRRTGTKNFTKILFLGQVSNNEATMSNVNHFRAAAAIANACPETAQWWGDSSFGQSGGVREQPLSPRPYQQKQPAKNCHSRESGKAAKINMCFSNQKSTEIHSAFTFVYSSSVQDFVS